MRYYLNIFFEPFNKITCHAVIREIKNEFYKWVVYHYLCRTAELSISEMIMNVKPKENLPAILILT